MRVWVAVITLLAHVSLAIYADEAGSVDYHLALLGQPGNSTTFFHQPVASSKASLIYTLSERNVLGAVNPKDGSLVWRQLLSSNRSAPHGHISTGEGQEVLYSAVDNTAAAWSTSDGRFLWQESIPGHAVKHVSMLSSDQRSQGKLNGDAIALWQGKQSLVQRLDAESGAVQWSFEDASGSLPYRVVPSGGEVYVVGLSKAMLKGYKIHVTILDAQSGRATNQVILGSESEIASEHDILHTGAVGRADMIIWTDATRSTIKANILGSKNIASFDISSGSEATEQLSVHCSSNSKATPAFLVQVTTAKTNWAQVYHVDAKADMKKAKIVEAYHLPKLEEQSAFSGSAVGNEVYFVRISSEVQLFSSASHGMLARWPLNPALGLTDNADATSPVHVASEVVARGDASYAVRSAVLRHSGDWVLVRNGDVQWTRPEQLANIVNAGWIEPSKPSAMVEELEAESEIDSLSAFIHRVKRHAGHAASMPTLLEALPGALTRWLNSFAQVTHFKDRAFGFDRQVLAILENGRRVSINPEHPQTVRDVSSSERSDIQDLARSLSDRFSAYPSGSFSFKITDGGLSGQGVHGHTWHFLTPKEQTIFDVVSSPTSEPIASIGKVLGDRRVLYKYLNPNAILVLAKDVSAGQLSVYLLDAVSGSLLYSSDHEYVDLERPVTATMTENWFTYSYTSDANRDAMSRGHLLFMGELYESEFPNDRGPLGAVGNYSAVTPALVTPGSLKPHVITQTFHIPEEVSHMAITQTQQGITSRQLLLALSGSKGVVGIPHQLLDPRRPVGKAPTTQQMEEGLMQYNPLIDFDPKIYLTHRNEVLGIEKVVSSPSDMESTSLVFAYGLDVFGTRVAPSFAFDILSASFNRVQLVMTVIALTGSVVGVAPLIKRKQTNVLWQNT